jgi:hypothetical protein
MEVMIPETAEQDWRNRSNSGKKLINVSHTSNATHILLHSRKLKPFYTESYYLVSEMMKECVVGDRIDDGYKSGSIGQGKTMTSTFVPIIISIQTLQKD